MKKSLRILVSAIGLLGLTLSLWNCNISETGGGFILQMKLDDSLALSAGKYDLVVVDLCDTTRAIKIGKVFNKPYVIRTDSVKLANLPLPSRPPDPLVIQVTAYKNQKPMIRYETVVIGNTPVRYPSVSLIPPPIIPIDSTLAPTSIVLLMTTPLILSETDAPIPLIAGVLPVGANDTLLWTSLDTTVARVTPDNKVKPVKAGTTTLTAKSKADPKVDTSFLVKVVVPVKVDSIAIAPKSMVLYTGGESRPLVVVMKGKDTTGAQYNLSSNEPSIASVDANGKVKGLKAGNALIIAKVVGSELSDTCRVSVVTDIPEMIVTANQSIAFGAEAAFKVTVTQAYGSVAEIKADMDGDSIFELSVTGKDTTTFKRVYSEVKTVTVRFEAKDTEGNSVSLQRKVIVGAPGTPQVSILSPSKDTVIGVDSLKIRFTMKDTAQKIDAVVDSTVKGLKDGVNIIRVSRENAGGEGSDEITATVDKVKPTLTIVATAAATGTPALTLTGKVSDAAAGVLSLNVAGAFSGNGEAMVSGENWTKSGLILNEGLNVLVATAADKAGNISTDTVRVTLDTKKPGIPVVMAPAASRISALKWTWTKADANGSGRFKVKVGAGAEVDVGTATEYSLAAPTDNTMYGLSVKETDAVAGDGEWSAAKIVLYDSKAPDPSLSINAATTNAPKWTWSSFGGTGFFRWHYKGGTPGKLGSGVVTSYTPPATISSGTYTLCVQEQDSPEWGDVWGKTPETCKDIIVDKTGPVITDIQYKDGYITNLPSLRIKYKADGDTASFACTLIDGAEKTCSVDAKDGFGNITTVKVKIWHRKEVVFVSKSVVSGKKDGSSWLDAYPELYTVLDTNKVWPAGTEIWVAEGAYNKDPEANDLFVNASNISVLGGFSKTGTAVDSSSRMPTVYESIIPTRTYILRESRSLVWDGFYHQYNGLGGGMMLSYGHNTLIRQCRFFYSSTNGGLYVTIGIGGSGDSYTTIQDCSIMDSFLSGPGVQISSRGIIENCAFSRNTFTTSRGVIVVTEGGTATVNNSIFKNNAIDSDTQGPLNIEVEGNLTISKSQLTGGRTSIKGSGSVLYSGDNTTLD